MGSISSVIPVSASSRNEGTPASQAQAPKPSVDDILAAGQESKTWVGVAVESEGDEYVIRIPKTLSKSDVRVSSTGKSLVCTFRTADVQRDSKLAFTLVDAENNRAGMVESGAFNFTLSLQPRKR